MKKRSIAALTGILVSYDISVGKGLVREDQSGNEFYIDKDAIAHGIPDIGNVVVFEPCIERLAYCGVAIIVKKHPASKVYLS